MNNNRLFNIRVNYSGGQEIFQKIDPRRYTHSKLLTELNEKVLSRFSFEQAYDYLMAIPLGHWARHSFDPTPHVDHVTNNLSECFNAWVDPIRGFSFLNIMEGLRVQVMKRVAVRRREGLKCNTILMPRVMRKINETYDQSRSLRLKTESGGGLYEVEDYSFTFVVNMGTRQCNCNRWELTGIPCRHAWVVISYLRDDAENYVSHNHTTEAYRRAYDMSILPIPDHRFWPANLSQEECTPPVIEKKPGRPHVVRLRHPSEGNSNRRKVPIHKQRRPPTCSICGDAGHNKTSCPRVKKAKKQAQNAPNEAPGSSGVEAPTNAPNAPTNSPTNAPNDAPGPSGVQTEPQNAAATQGKNKRKRTVGETGQTGRATSSSGRGRGTTEGRATAVRGRGTTAVRGRGRGTTAVRGRGFSSWFG